MNNQESVQRGAARMKETADRLSEVAPAASETTAKEVALMTARLESLDRRPPRPLTTDFDIAGKEVPFPTPPSSEEDTLERIIGESDLLPIWFLEQGVVAQRSVARVVLTKSHTVDGATFPPGTGWATGFLVAPTLLLTNNHVIPDAAFASKIKFQFNFQLGPDGGELATESFLPDAASFFHTNAALDYSLIRVRANPPAPGGGTTPIEPGQRWGVLPLIESPVLRKDQLVNIIQHPDGRRKEVALQNNKVEKLFENTVRYTTDTEPGSSGSPVFDNLWQLVALHHSGGDVAGGQFVNNEGIRLDAIVTDLRAAFAGQTILTELGI